jgi:nitrous oxidase accessory protein
MKYLSIILLLISNLLFAKTWRVKDSAGLYKSVEKASNGDTVLILKGNYQIINLEINKKLTIIGSNYPVLDAQFKGEIFKVQSSGVQVRGILFQNVGEISSIDWAGIKVLESENVLIENNKFRNCYFGIYLSACSKIKVIANEIIGQPKEEQTTGNGIHAWKCDSILIEKNSILGHRDGIYFEFVTNSTIQKNLSTKNIRYGLHFMFSHNNTYEFNQFKKNGAGVAVMYTKKVTMKNNIFDENWGGAAYGILLKDISDSRIEHNQFKSNTIGIYMEGCSRTTFSKNEFSQNGIALRIQADCDENTINQNNFRANTFDVATNGNTVFNNLTQNYWDKYTGYDLNHDGIGDVLYRPVSLFSTLTERVPQAMMLLRSFTATLLDKIEKIIPSLTPENLKDEKPIMKPIKIEPINPKLI